MSHKLHAEFCGFAISGSSNLFTIPSWLTRGIKKRPASQAVRKFRTTQTSGAKILDSVLGRWIPRRRQNLRIPNNPSQSRQVRLRCGALRATTRPVNELS